MHKFKVFFKIIIEGQEVTERTSPLPAEGQPTKAVLSQTCTGVFFIRSNLVQFLQCFFLPNPPADHLANHRGPSVVRGPQFDKRGLGAWGNFVIR
jgi:hypothetical protein